MLETFTLALNFLISALKSERMSAPPQHPQPNLSVPLTGQPLTYSSQLAHQYQQNQTQRFPHYAPSAHYKPQSFHPALASTGSQTPGPTAQFLQAGMGITPQSGRSTPYQQPSGTGGGYQYANYGQSTARAGTPKTSTTPVPGSSSTANAGTSQGSSKTVTNPALHPHLQQYAHYFQNIQNLGSHFTGFSGGTNYNFSGSTGTGAGAGAGTGTGATGAATTSVNYNSAYGNYGATSATTRPTGGYGNTRAVKDDDDDLLPGMDDADYSAQSQYQSQSKADLK